MSNAPDLLGGSPPDVPPESSGESSSVAIDTVAAALNAPTAMAAASSTVVNADAGSAEGAAAGPTSVAEDGPSTMAATGRRAWIGWMGGVGGVAGSLVHSARDVVGRTRGVGAAAAGSATGGGDERAMAGSASDASVGKGGTDAESGASSAAAIPPSPSASASAFLSSLGTSVNSLTRSIPSVNVSDFPIIPLPHIVTGRNTLPDKTTASQVLMFRQLLHTKCRPGLRLSRKYEGTAAQKAVLHMPWWERGIAQSGKMIISYDNLITRLWLNGAIVPFAEGSYAAPSVPPGNEDGALDTLINEQGLPPVPHKHWVDRLGFQQDDPVTDFRSGGVLSLAMLVHVVESCPSVHARFLPKPETGLLAAADTYGITGTEGGGYLDDGSGGIGSICDVLRADASVLPFGITCINVTDMLAKFLMFAKSVDKMDALLSSKPFWGMFIDPNAMLVLQEVSLDLLCDVVVELGRERRLPKPDQGDKASSGDLKSMDASGMPSREGKVTVFDFAEIMERTEKRVGDELLGAGPRNVKELYAVARRIKSKHRFRIDLKEKHARRPTAKKRMGSAAESVVGAVAGGFASMLKRGDRCGENANECDNDKHREGASENVEGSVAAASASTPVPVKEEVEVEFYGGAESNFIGSGEADVAKPVASASDTADIGVPGDAGKTTVADEFDLIGMSLDPAEQELLDALDAKVDSTAAFSIFDDDEDLLS